MSVDSRFVAVEPAMLFIFGTLQVGLFRTGRPALAYFDGYAMPVPHVSISIANRALPRDDRQKP